MPLRALRHLQALFLVPCERAVLRKSEDAEDTKLRRETVTPKRELETPDKGLPALDHVAEADSGVE